MLCKATVYTSEKNKCICTFHYVRVVVVNVNLNVLNFQGMRVNYIFLKIINLKRLFAPQIVLKRAEENYFMTRSLECLLWGGGQWDRMGQERSSEFLSFSKVSYLQISRVTRCFGRPQLIDSFCVDFPAARVTQETTLS